MTTRQAMLRGAFALGAFALVTAGSVALTRTLTAERIDAHQLAYQHRQLQEVLPPSLSAIPVEEVLKGAFTLPTPSRLGHRGDTQGWQVHSFEQHSPEQHSPERHSPTASSVDKHNAGESAVILPVVTRQGYNGEIRLLVGIDQHHRITGVRVTHHQETPGLGDDIEHQRSDWITHFNGLRLDDLPPEGWAVTKDGGHFDTFAGATITPRAVVNAVHQALTYTSDTELPTYLEEPAP